MEIGWKILLLGLIVILSSEAANAAVKCKVCDSTNPECLTSPEKVTDTTCADASKSCFTSIDNNGAIKRGCIDDTNKCEDKTICKECTPTDAGCNTEKDLFWCNTCDSSADPNCAQKEGTIKNQFCDSGIKTCVNKINANKQTERRCATKDEKCTEGDKKCATCTDAGCNKSIFPTDRVQCYQCDKTNCGTPVGSLPCKLYDEAEKCFVYGTSETEMTRGCLSDETAYKKCTEQSPKEKCKECGTNGCNSAEFKVSQAAKCIQCKVEDATCRWGFTADKATACTTKQEYWKPEGCYTNKLEAENVARGCLSDIDCSAAATTCTSCTGDACNLADAMGKMCVVCRYPEDKECGSKIEGDTYKKTCRNPVTQSDQGCYTERWEDGIIIRSCLVDADPKTRKNCLDPNYKACASCSTADNCNTDEPPNSAHSLSLATGLLTLALLSLKFF